MTNRMCGGSDVSSMESDPDLRKRADIVALPIKREHDRVRNRRCPNAHVDTDSPLRNRVKDFPSVHNGWEFRKGIPSNCLTARDSLPRCSATGNME